MNNDQLNAWRAELRSAREAQAPLRVLELLEQLDLSDPAQHEATTQLQRGAEIAALMALIHGDQLARAAQALSELTPPVKRRAHPVELLLPAALMSLLHDRLLAASAPQDPASPKLTLLAKEIVVVLDDQNNYHNDYDYGGGYEVPGLEDLWDIDRNPLTILFSQRLRCGAEDYFAGYTGRGYTTRTKGKKLLERSNNGGFGRSGFDAELKKVKAPYWDDDGAYSVAVLKTPDGDALWTFQSEASKA